MAIYRIDVVVDGDEHHLIRFLVNWIVPLLQSCVGIQSVVFCVRIRRIGTKCNMHINA